MGRQRRIPREAKATTISLTPRQHIAFQKLQVHRQEHRESKPTLTEVMVEGFQMVLRREGVPDAELERVFPKEEPRKAAIRMITKRRKG